MTQFPAEYQCGFPGQTKKYAARIEYFDTPAIRRFLNEQLRHYSLFALENDPRDSTWSPEQKRVYKSRSDTALSVLCSMYCDKDDFRDRAAAKATLKRNYDYPEGGGVERLIQWSLELLNKKNQAIGTFDKYVDAKTARKLNAIMVQLVSQKDGDRSPSIWPLVKKVT